MTQLNDAHAVERATQVRVVLVLAALGLLIFGLFLGLSGHGDCGSAWSPSSEPLSDQMTASMTGMPDDYYASCQQQLGSDGTLAAVLVALAGASALGAAVLWSRERPAPRQQSTDTPTASRQQRTAPRSTTPRSQAVVELTPDGPRPVDASPSE